MAISAYINGESYYWKGVDMIADFLAILCQFPEPYVHYAHNAQYDWRYILPYLAEHEIACEICMRTETDIYEVRIFIGTEAIVMRDSFAFWNSTLKKLASAYCPELPKEDLDFEKETFDPDNAVHESYARRDAMILAVALPRLNTKLNKHFSISMSVTTASTAMRAWQQSLSDDDIFECSKEGQLESFTREGYYGGLVFLTSNQTFGDGTKVVAETVDINSSYPAMMEKYGVPMGRVTKSKDYKEGKMGMYHVRVKAPDDLIIPILPRRTQKGFMAWSRGEFDTVVTNRELIFAVNHGYKILKIYSGVYWEKTVFPFSEFIELCKTIRREYKDLPEEALAKLMQNSLYGRFGSRRERMRIFHPTCNEEMQDAMPLDDCDYFWLKKENAENIKCIPHWAAFITAHGRLTLLKNAYAIGPSNVIYGDTDSLTIKTGHLDKIDIGLEYGQFKLEKSWTEFRAIAPKVYSGRLASFIDKEGVLRENIYKGAAKGLPRRNLNEEHWKDLIATGKTSASALSLSSLRVALAKGNKEARQLKRVSSDIRNSANWELHGTDVRAKIA